jgi:hypothetical protein
MPNPHPYKTVSAEKEGSEKKTGPGRACLRAIHENEGEGKEEG